MEGLRNKLGCIVLAAGEASRMGEVKQLLRWRDKTLLQHAIAHARGVSNLVVVVSGAHTEAIRAEITESDQLRMVHNPDWAAGMGSSIACGVRFIQTLHPHLSGLLILLADQPLVSDTALEKMTEQWAIEKPGYVAAFYGGRRGVPALFSRALFSELAALRGMGGAKQLMEYHASDGIEMRMPEAGVDLDTPEEWARFIAANP